MLKRLQSWVHRDVSGKPGTVPQAKPLRSEGTHAADEEDDQSVDSFRETIEQIAIAFILAFIFRTFAAEPFVIPTGSMAPTLFGRHKEFICEKCECPNVIGASDELDEDSGLVKPPGRIEEAVCRNCGAVNDVKTVLAHTGDRILVTKYPYEVGDPERFDVFVFKFPEEPITNFIKRLVGLPGETILIWGGDVYRQVGDDNFEILRKDPETQRRIQIPVYDDRFPPSELLAAEWPERWAAVSRVGNGGIDGWQESNDGFTHDADARTFQLKSASPDWRWIRYRHYQSLPEHWRTLERNDPFTVQARLVADFCSYNAFVPYQNGPNEYQRKVDEIDFGVYWSGDLTVSCVADVQSVEEGAALLLELVEGVQRYRCHIDLASGKARIYSINVQNDPEEEILLGEGETSVSGTGSHGLVFANVDSRLCLWANGDLVDFGEGASYRSEALTGNDLPTIADLTPVGIAARGATVTISDLLLERDIYYRADADFPMGAGQAVQKLADELERPHDWADTYDLNRGLIGRMTIEVGPHHYLALGDNSPRSRDSRVWRTEHRTVARELLVGKAFWIYWPHGVPFLNEGRGFTIVNNYQHDKEGPVEIEDYPKYTFPFYPNLWRMRLIR
jgi:signal peptidase I